MKTMCKILNEKKKEDRGDHQNEVEGENTKISTKKIDKLLEGDTEEWNVNKALPQTEWKHKNVKKIHYV